MPSFSLPLVKSRFEQPATIFTIHEHTLVDRLMVFLCVCFSKTRGWDGRAAVRRHERGPQHHRSAQLYLPGGQRHGVPRFQKCKFSPRNFFFCLQIYLDCWGSSSRPCILLFSPAWVRKGTEEISSCVISSPVKAAEPTQETGQGLNIVAAQD